MIIHPFDLQARAELAMQSLVALTDQERDGLIYFLADWRARPPRADHGLWDYGDGCGRHIDALSLARRMLRPDSIVMNPDDAEQRIEDWMLRLLDDDGLSWLPHEPWAVPWGTELLMTNWKPVDVLAEVSWAQRGTLLGLTSRYASTGSTKYLDAAIRLVDALRTICLKHADGLYFPEGYYRKDGWKTTSTALYAGIEEYNAAVAVALLRLHTISNYEPALTLADGLLRFALKHTQGYAPDGHLVAGSRPGVEDHLHTKTNFILSVLMLGIQTRQPQYIAWAQRAYSFAKEWGTDFGFFPEGLGHRHGEVCCFTDMIEIAMLLGKHVHRRYYADVERYGRNHLLESQFLSVQLLQQAVDYLPVSEHTAPYGGLYSTSTDVVQRLVGGFASRSTLNDAFHLDACAMMQCCNAAGLRGLYDLWDGAIEIKAGAQLTAYVHLRFSVETGALRVVSHEPAQGILEITPREDTKVFVRIPDGETEARIIHAGNTEVQLTQAENGYVTTQARANDIVQIQYELRERSAEYCVGKSGHDLSITGHWRGETLMTVEPVGQYYPLYQREAEISAVIPELPLS